MRTHRHQGFSLIELAIGLTVMSALALSLMVPLARHIDNRQTNATRDQIESARQALLAFAVANQRLPCPATPETHGTEAWPGGTPQPATGACQTFNGLLPAVTLGLVHIDSLGFAIDGWGNPDSPCQTAPVPDCRNRLHYAVAPASTALPSPFTKTNGMKTPEVMRTIADANNMLYVCSRHPTGPGCSGAIALASGTAVAVIWTQGPNDRDSTYAPSLDELQNRDGDLVFVSRPRGEVLNQAFDDEVIWISPHTLFSRLLSAGMLP